VKSPKFPYVFTLAPPSLFKSGLAVIAPLSGRTVKSTVGESLSLGQGEREGKNNLLWRKKFTCVEHLFYFFGGGKVY
jgi:hypothetical protein